MGTDRAAIVDVETTGISRQDVIVEIAVYFLLSPGRPASF